VTPRPTIHVIVVDDAASAKCDARCGLDLSCPDVLESTTQVLHKMFGKRVGLEYVRLDAIQPGPLAEVADRVKGGELALPLLLINGKPRVSGYFDLHLLQESIQAEIEMAAR
jgi:hypothetical protein